MKKVLIIIFLIMSEINVFAQDIDSSEVKKKENRITSLEFNILAGSISHARKISHKWFLGGSIGLGASKNLMITHKGFQALWSMETYRANLYAKYVLPKMEFELGPYISGLNFVAFNDEGGGYITGIGGMISLRASPHFQIGFRGASGILLGTLSYLERTFRFYVTPFILRYVF